MELKIIVKIQIFQRFILIIVRANVNSHSRALSYTLKSNVISGNCKHCTLISFGCTIYPIYPFDVDIGQFHYNKSVQGQYSTSISSDTFRCLIFILAVTFSHRKIVIILPHLNRLIYRITLLDTHTHTHTSARNEQITKATTTSWSFFDLRYNWIKNRHIYIYRVRTRTQLKFSSEAIQI